LTEERKNVAKASTSTIAARKRNMATITLQDTIVSNLLKTINEMESRENDTDHFELEDFKNDTAIEASLIRWRALRERNLTLMQNSTAEEWQKSLKGKTEEVDVLIPRVQSLTEKFRKSREENGFPSTGHL
jgi:phage FluMu gp28-like protein